MPHHRPLTAAELAAIYDRDPSPNVLRLLQEIGRLHETVRRAEQVRRTLEGGGSYYVPAVIWECFERELDAEPCLKDLPTPRQQRRRDELARRREERRKGQPRRNDE